MSDNFAVCHYPTSILEYSDNVRCWDQRPRPGGPYRYILVCCNGIGFVQCVSKAENRRYTVIGAWLLREAQGMDLSIRTDVRPSLLQSPLARLERLYNEYSESWVWLEASTQSRVVLQLPRYHDTDTDIVSS